MVKHDVARLEQVVRFLTGSFFLLMVQGSVLAQTSYTWNGSVSSAWNNNANWTPNTGFPLAADHATIVAAANMPQLDMSRSVTNLTVTSGTLDLNGFTLTSTGTGSFSGGAVNNGVLVPNSIGTFTFGPTTFGAVVNGTTGTLVFNGATFNSTVDLTKTGSSGDQCHGNTVFNGTTTLSVTNGMLYPAYTGTTVFNGNLLLNCTGAGLGIRTGQSGGTTTLAAGRTISVGGGLGFTTGGLHLRNFTQLGSTPQNLALGNTADLYFEQGSTWNGDMTATAGRMMLAGTTFNGTGTFTKTGPSGDGSSGGCVFNGTTEFINTNTGNFSITYIGTDAFNGDVLVNNTSTGQVRFGQNGGLPTLAAGRTISVGGTGFNSGTLTLRGFTQLGTTPQNLALGISALLYFEQGSTWNANVVATAGRMFLAGTTFNGTGTFTKTGPGGDGSYGGCVFNANTEFTNTSTDNFSITYIGTDAFNGDVLVNNTSTGMIRFGQNGGLPTLAAGRTISVGGAGFNSGSLYLRGFTQLSSTPQNLALGNAAELYFEQGSTWNGDMTATAGRMFLAGTIFNGTATFTKTGPGGDGSNGGCVFNGTTEFINTNTGNFSITYIGSDAFNADVLVNNTSTGQIRFGQNGGLATLAAGNTISVGSAGFNVGSLFLRGFTQLGTTAQNLALGTAATLNFEQGSTWNGDMTAAAGSVLLAGTTFNGTGTFTKTGTISGGSAGGCVFNGTTEFINTSTGNFSIDFSGPDLFNADVFVNCTSTGQIRFGQSTGSATLAAGRTISVGGSGFNSGSLFLRNFTQLGTTPQNLTLGTAAILYFEPGSTWNGNMVAAAGGMYLSGTTFNGTGVFKKTGSSSDASAGGCTFNGTTEFIHTGTGNFSIDYTGTDAFNADVLVNSTSTGQMRFGQNGGSASLANGSTISVGGLGFNSGSLHFRNFTQVGGTAQYLALGTNASLTFATGNTFNGNIITTSAALFLNGTVFNGTSRFTKTGTSGDQSVGGNTFNQTAEFLITGAGVLSLDYNAADAFNGDLLVNSTSTGQITFGQSTGSAVLAAGRIIAPGALGFNSGTLSLRNFTQVGGSPQSLMLGTAAACFYQTGTTFNGDLTTSAGNMHLNGATFNGTARISKTGAGSNSCTGNNLFAGNTELTNSGVGLWLVAATGADVYNGNLLLNSTGAGGINFGNATGTTLLNGGTLGIGAAGFTAGTIVFRNFTKNGTSAATLTGNINTQVTFATGSTFNGDLSVTTGHLYLNGSVFNGDCIFNKTAAPNNNCAGGNTFNGDVEINAGGQLSLTSITPDDFNGNATFRRLSAGAFMVGNNYNVNFSANVSTVGSTGGPVTFGNGSGRTIFDGTTVQTFSSDAATPPNVRNLTLAMTGSGELQLLGNVQVTTDVAFTSGVVKPSAATSTSNGLLILANGITFSDAADANSHVDGFVRKIGNVAFSFPVGNAGILAPINISAPATNTHHFTAKYVHEDPHPTYHAGMHDPSIHHVDRCEYWILDRTNSTTNVTVTLSYDSVRSCGVSDLSTLVVARWDGSTWRDHGQGALSGNMAAGTITTAGPVTAFSPFTLASTNAMNPLPIELIAFDAVDDGQHVRTYWSTASEMNNERFEVERSADASSFEVIGSVAGAGNSQSTLHYELVDEAPLNGTGYYRLKQIDLDGQYTYSDVVAVTRSGADDPLTAWPNPVAEELHVVVNGASAAQQVRVHDAAGRLVLERNVAANETSLTIPMASAPQGCLFLSVVLQDGSVLQRRLIKP